MERDTMEVDVLVIGGGPAGLATAIKLMQLARRESVELTVCLLEKGSEIGAHILSGAVIDPKALDELFGGWRQMDSPIVTPVASEKFMFLTEHNAITLPSFLLPKVTQNHGNYIASLGNVCRWLAEKAEGMGVQVFPGFSASDIVFHEDGRVKGVVAGEMGIDRSGKRKESFEPGVELHAKYTVLAEGCRGSLSEKIIEHYGLNAKSDPQTYGLGLKELWRVPDEVHQAGLVLHTAGWPLGRRTYGGSFLYHLEDNQVAVGFVVGLDYDNPYLSPFEEFQRYKTHPLISKNLQGGERISYGARALNEGGLQALPDLIFPGGLLVGCSAGFLNVPKIKGSHNAIKTGMLAGSALFEAITEEFAELPRPLVETYPESVRSSWVWDELYSARNFRPAFAKWGLIGGTLYNGLEQMIRGRVPWTFSHLRRDNETLLSKDNVTPIDYPKPDGVFSFDRLSSVFVSNTNHEENQPIHLKLKDESIPIFHNLELYDSPEQRYCPAGVYEVLRDDDGSNPRLQINAQNCLHCKTCDIKDPTQNIVWTVPEGAGGPNYPNM